MFTLDELFALQSCLIWLSANAEELDIPAEWNLDLLLERLGHEILEYLPVSL